MYTRVFGRLSFVIQLPKTQKGKLKKQLFQPLTLLSIETDVRQRLQLQKLRNATIMTPLPSLQTDPTKLSIALFLAEFLYHALKGEQQNELLFDYVVSSLQWLDGADEHIANFHLVFLMRLSQFLGFYPNLADYADNDYFDLRASVFCQQPPVHRDFLLPPEAGKIRLMMRMRYENMHLFVMSHHERNRCVEVMMGYYRLHLPDFPELKSLAVLREVYEK
jgi:DNA repair protein RecO (recombination protein O)